MIASLRGLVGEKNANDVVIDVNGVGYRVLMSLLALARLPEEGEPVKLRIRTVVREDSLDLYGFGTKLEEELFLLLTSVSQVGPKLALNVMSGLEAETLVQVLAKGEVGRLTKIRGVGRKTAERLVLELKDKVKLLALEGGAPEAAAGTIAGASPLRDDLVSALVNLGYKPPQAERAADAAAERLGPAASFEELFREALKELRQR
ncbi:MAG: Holliday junction branch migration protein RuvA [Myxococcaceae bacterium]|nr:Holliday junction branch migration protein RuvA [Myxococcaceae bacterium]